VETKRNRRNEGKGAIDKGRRMKERKNVQKKRDGRNEIKVAIDEGRRNN